MIQSVKRALQHDEFELQYQPIIHLQGEPMRKAEALIRWNDPVKGRVPPLEFIPMAEQTGLILPLGDDLAPGNHSILLQSDQSFYMRFFAVTPPELASEPATLDWEPHDE